MNTNKTIIITTISILLIIVLIFIFTKTNNKTENNLTETNNTMDYTRNPFNTNNTQNNTVKDIEKNNSIETDNAIDTSNYTEVQKLNDLKKKISEWELTKDYNVLISAVNETSKYDNESFYYVWVNLIKNKSSELYILAEKNINNKEYIKNIYGIMTWFIDMSGEYEKLTISQKTEINTQYKKIESLLK